MKLFRLALVLGIAHGVADAVAGWLLGSLAFSYSLERVAALVLVYNVLAFGGQPFVGLIADRIERPRAVAFAGLGLLALGLLLSPVAAPVAVLCVGLGSAAFHVGGGALAWCSLPERAGSAGIFAAPGVVGLALGGLLAIQQLAAAWMLLLPLLAVIMLLACQAQPRLPYMPNLAHSAVPDRHDWIMLVLLCGIALRSLVWNICQWLADGRYEWLLALAIAAAFGKVAGGLLADRIGWRRWMFGCLLCAAPLLVLGERNEWFMLLGVACLQAASPAALATSFCLLPRQPALAAGLSFGLAIAIGGLPLLSGWMAWISGPGGTLALLATSIMAVWWSMSRLPQAIAPPTPWYATAPEQSRAP
jgi:FSR family fosmidomycin resistance protein-like MFS transporter